MGELSLPDEEIVKQAMEFCERFGQPYGAVLFGMLVARHMGLSSAPMSPGGGGLRETGWPWPDLSEGKQQRIKALARSVEVEPRQLQNVYEFAEEEVTIVAARSQLGQSTKAQMQSAALLYALARRQVYGDTAVAWRSIREACSDAGVDDPGGNFSTYMKDAGFPAEYAKGTGDLNVTGSVVSAARKTLKGLVQTTGD